MLTIIFKYSSIIVLVIYSFCVNINFSQNLYNTKQGTVTITAKYNDTVLSGKGKAVLIDLDYATANLKIEYSLNALKTGI